MKLGTNPWFTTGCPGVGRELMCGMRYTQGQVRDLLQLPVETFRTWREVIPALASHRGHGPTFLPGDIVALAVMTEVIRGFGVRVGTVREQIDDLFESCANMSWLALEPCVAILDSVRGRLVLASDLEKGLQDAGAFVVACRPIVKHLRAQLLEVQPETVQGHLHFPPQAVAAAMR